MPDADTDPERLAKTDLVPFQAAIAHDVSGMMLSHIRYRKLDSQWIASLSTRIARELLRDRMGFQGVVMTDDLDMGAVRNHYSIRTAIAQILAADIDIALICHQSPKIETAFHEIVNDLKHSDKRMEKGLTAVKRIMALKRKYLSPHGHGTVEEG
jgi:beta-N-acetylhexosaminidase